MTGDRLDATATTELAIKVSGKEDREVTEPSASITIAAEKKKKH